MRCLAEQWCGCSSTKAALPCTLRAQVYELSSMHFLPKDWIMERWEEGFYITAMAGSAGGSSLVVMSKGTPYTQQSYKARRPAFRGPWLGGTLQQGLHTTLRMLRRATGALDLLL